MKLNARQVRGVARRRAPAAIVGTLLAAGLLVGCGGGRATSEPPPNSSPTASSSRELTIDEMTVEYTEAAAKLKWPAGTEIPGPGTYTPEPGLNGELVGHVFEEGYGISIAQGQWLCAWEKEWVDAHGADPLREQTALTQLQGLKAMDLWTTYADNSMKDAVGKIVKAAALGDGAPMAHDVEINCK